MKSSGLCLIVFMLASGLSVSGQEKESNGLISHYGILREIMMEHKLEANVDLRQFADKPNFYALGAMEGLAGEILIIGSKPYNGHSKNKKLQIDSSFQHKASLLVSAEVDEWSEYRLEKPVSSIEMLETEIKRMAKEHGINTAEAFPFMLSGKVSTLQWHVINALEAVAQNHEAFKKSGLSGVDEELDVEILGFYSERHEGIFTHHGSFLHLHFKASDQVKMGHVDGLSLNNGVTLMLPKTLKP